jgi:putative hydrolase of the HAD superfamily
MMRRSSEITTLFLDIGGVMLTDGWGHQSRALAAKVFALNPEEMEERHRQIFSTYELGRMTLEEYLHRTVFYQERPFSREQFRDFIFAQSQPFPEMIELIRNLKAEHGLKVGVVNNEGRELNSHRIRTFKLDEFVDFFVSSCFVHLCKPDAEIFRMALDIGQTPARQIAYVENTAMFVQIAEGLGIQGVYHTDCQSTRAKLAALGLVLTGSQKDQL